MAQSEAHSYVRGTADAPFSDLTIAGRPTASRGW